MTATEQDVERFVDLPHLPPGVVDRLVERTTDLVRTTDTNTNATGDAR